MIEISMTTFVDFVLASGTSRLTIVRNAKATYQIRYDPARDFYRPLREAIIEMHQSQRPRESLDDLLLTLKDAKKTELFRECIEAYKRWCGRKQFKWVRAYSTDWQSGELVVRVNPELGMRVNGSPNVVKLYFKSETPSKRRLETMFHLLRSSFPKDLDGSMPGILDVRRGSLFSPTRDLPGIEALLVGEAAAFQTIWNQV